MSKELGKKMRELRKSRGWTLKYIANLLDLKGFSTYSNWEYGRSVPDLDILKKIADLYEVPLDYLASNDDLAIIDHQSMSILHVPILGTITAGKPVLAEEHIIDWMEIPNMWNLKNGEVFVLEVKGDSMIGSRIYDGDKVIVKVQPDVESGEIAVVNVNGRDATLKRVKKLDGKVILYPDNPRYDPLVVQHEEARIIGKVVQVMFEPGK